MPSDGDCYENGQPTGMVACAKCLEPRLRYSSNDLPGWCRRCRYDNFDEYFGPGGVNETFKPKTKPKTLAEFEAVGENCSNHCYEKKDREANAKLGITVNWCRTCGFEITDQELGALWMAAQKKDD